MSEQTTFGGRLKDFRKAKKLSGEELGGIVGIGRGQVSSIENNKSMLTLEGCIKLCNAYPELDANWLITGQGEMLKDSEQSNGDCWPLLQAERIKSETLEALLSKHGIIK
ncbi:helix-turn-helix domain-containing protein [Pontibacter virosus]|uniref:DNA-binding XRE family transcriptional regulator n=1 Tax=Pontibacter virosus TaxID=1765052 RepID=A0A2U1B418_9BACT|nr:helix-turn-helix transcriptional regulator [Pontibacter virosus]PVY43257.1 DNA-binding XRE family transcriptional regulator [Pontibacter virosus]